MPNYIALVYKEPHTDYGVVFPDFPGCVTTGETLDEAYNMAVEALKGHVGVMEQDADPIPTPSRLEDILADPEHNGAITTFFVYLATQKAIRINISVSEKDLEVIDRRAQNLGMSLSTYLVKAGIEWRTEP